MVRARIHLRSFEYHGIHSSDASDDTVEVVGLKSEQHAVPIRFGSWVSHVRMLMRIPGVDLHDQLAVRDDPLVFLAAMRTLSAEHSLIPATAGLNVSDRDQRLCLHRLMNDAHQPAGGRASVPSQ